MPTKIASRPKGVKAPVNNIVKACECGEAYDLAGWLALKRVGLQLCGRRDSAFELRDCVCGSTISLAFHIVRCPGANSAGDTEAFP